MTEDELKAKIADLEAEKAALKNKNSELIDREKAEKARADKAQRDAEEAAENATSANSTELEKAVKRAEKAEKAIAEAEEQRQAVEKSLRQERGDAALSKMIAGANVDGSHVNMLTKALRAELQFGDDGQPLLDGKSIEDYGKSFFGQKGEGHHYVRAANNGGGVVSGADGKRAPAMTKENFNLTEYGKLRATDPAAADAIKSQLGLNY